MSSRRNDYHYDGNDHQYRSPLKSNVDQNSFYESSYRSRQSYHQRTKTPRSSYDSPSSSTNSKEHNSPYHYRVPSNNSTRASFGAASTDTNVELPKINLPDSSLSSKLQSCKSACENSSQSLLNVEQQYAQQVHFWEKIRTDIYREGLRSDAAVKSLNDFVNNVSF
ncbi:histone H2B-K119 ubiquitin ligase complex (HULC) subunit Shf1 [Schizosaccharomyces pombe]|uniref:Small histone ubiquitination factor 1 n=1 Tax=Schizosaccharomyces pombe (strain 972 / ATCC 24843) TaxID=284812 RepID=SHF1_SCHPO|nr:small histone ubiquitination factor Shf1 [Schizosaccharomyces pombe]Q9UUI2.1 RecName: Full=Small histone ubiquitination factor 1 [Schizosaccharomyces pombe 972h-]CAB52722.1 small histone ubiquitination factor Shf1 [Schizosaccharomyces pombe]|eukprot:NP_594735.1 small histone ubiquitination factor Shf1 [Schizosaccharomyces pombe]